MKMEAISVVAHKHPPRVAALVSVGAGLLLLGIGFARFAFDAAREIRFPYELDYGEGIVWQQLAMMFDGRGYGPIDGFPSIVFHYPPLFHALSEIGVLMGLDPLAAGRTVSVIASLLCTLLCGLIAARLTGTQDRKTAVICGLFAGLVSLAFAPVRAWAPLMRVDMVATAFSLLGIWFGMRAIERPRSVYLAALCFVAAVFAKQTAVAAPAACFATLLLVRPRTAARGIATCLGGGGAALAALAAATGGGFLRHVFFYNINRLDLPRLLWIGQEVALHALFFGVAGFGIAQLLRERLPAYRGAGSWRERRERLQNRPEDAAVLLVLLYLLATVATLGLIAKSGSNLNYFIEWMLVCAIFCGVAVRDAASLATRRAAAPALLVLLAPALLGIQSFVAGWATPYAPAMAPARLPQLRALGREVHAASRPVISDDMVLLRRSGKEVVWEPAIFAELASKGVWDERPFVARIRAHRFAFFVTVGDRGQRLFDSRYTPAVAEAIYAAYPVRRHVAGYTIHLPSEER